MAALEPVLLAYASADALAPVLGSALHPRPSATIADTTIANTTMAVGLQQWNDDGA
jgi:hypothetical protein